MRKLKLKRRSQKVSKLLKTIQLPVLQESDLGWFVADVDAFTSRFYYLSVNAVFFFF